jgi:phosphoribosylformimino-5-aminoimidazole carboxamide ribotide isomerase
MIIFPAIDLKDGKCVRLEKGEMDKATIFNDSPKEQAMLFEQQGFKFIHVVDLNGAIEGKSINVDAVQQILRNVEIPVQLGGGIRTEEAVHSWLEAGVNRVILGTIALRDPLLVKNICRKFPGQIVVGIDANHGNVAVEGWVETSTISVVELAKKFEGAGVSAIIYTDIQRDGLLAGPDIDGTTNLAKQISIPVIASGGISSNADLSAIKNLSQYGVEGVIVGKALYNKKIDINLALKMAENDA